MRRTQSGLRRTPLLPTGQPITPDGLSPAVGRRDEIDGRCDRDDGDGLEHLAHLDDVAEREHYGLLLGDRLVGYAAGESGRCKRLPREPSSALPAPRTPLPTNASRQTLPSDGASEDLPRRFGFRRVPSLLDESTGPLLAGATGGLLAPRLLESSAIAAQK